MSANDERICRTCLAPIWNEGGTVGRVKHTTGWSDRIERGGDSLVCFKAIHYRHVPLSDREAAIYAQALERGRAVADAEQAELRAEVERLQGVVDALAKQNVDDAERWSDVLAEAEAKVDLNVTAATSAIETHQLREAEQCQRAEAAERALADERAKAAKRMDRLRKYADEVVRPKSVFMALDLHSIASDVVLLAGPEPDATSDGAP